MDSQYYLNLAEFSLEKLGQILKTEDVLPSRQELKEDIDGRLETLAAMGIENLSDLIAALRTRSKLQDVAERSGLPSSYLVVLGREARSHRPKVVPLRSILGVNQESVDRLEAIGIKHSKHLFDRGRTVDERKQLSASAGVPLEELTELVRLSDLARIRGLGGAFVRLFYEAGADSIETLARCDPKALAEAARAADSKQQITSRVPSLKDVKQYVAMANDLAKVIEYEPPETTGGHDPHGFAGGARRVGLEKPSC